MKEDYVGDSTPGVVPWPRAIDESGRFGIAGEFLNLVMPCTEADPNAILLTFLTYCGNAMGRNFYVTAGADRHFGNLFLCIIGPTGFGRKGSAMSVVESFFKQGHPVTLGHQLKGMSTGEGVVYEVHDDMFRYIQDKKSGEYVRTLTEPNVPDKRLLYKLAEFQQCLANMRKTDSILSSILRTAWDQGDLSTPAKTSRATATGAHISIVCAMSREELLEETAATDAENGTLNRFLFCCSRRSKLLPQGGSFQQLYKTEAWRMLQERVAKNIETFEDQMLLVRTDDAEEIWGLNEQPHRGLYSQLNQPRIGLWGAVTARAPQMVLRLALIIAAINGRTEKTVAQPMGRYLIRPEHLTAAEEIWRYCDDSVKFIFGDKMDDPTAIEIMKALRAVAPQGLNRTQIYRIWKGHLKREDIDRSLLWISHSGVARVERIPTTGRPTEMWYAN
jgi:hypothetical protein